MNLRRFIVTFGALLLTLGLLLGGCQKKEEAKSEHPQEHPAEQSAQPAADSSQAAQPAQQ